MLPLVMFRGMPRRAWENPLPRLNMDIYFSKYIGAFARVAILFPSIDPSPESSPRMRASEPPPTRLCGVRADRRLSAQAQELCGFYRKLHFTQAGAGY